MDGDKKERERQSETAEADEQVERITWHKESFSQDPAEYSSPDNHLHRPQELKQRQSHRQAPRPGEIQSLRSLRQSDKQLMSHAVKRPREGKAEEAFEKQTDQWIVGRKCRRSDHEEHGRHIHGTSQNIFICEGPNQVAAALREDIDL